MLNLIEVITPETTDEEVADIIAVDWPNIPRDLLRLAFICGQRQAILRQARETPLMIDDIFRKIDGRLDVGNRG